jgi:hypothetical protein
LDHCFKLIELVMRAQRLDDPMVKPPLEDARVLPVASRGGKRRGAGCERVFLHTI